MNTNILSLAGTLLLLLIGLAFKVAPSADPRSFRKAPAVQDDLPDSVRKLLEQDRAYASRMEEVLRSRELTVRAMREKLDLRDEDPSEFELGFGASLRQFGTRAGTGQCHVRMIVVESGGTSWVAEARLEFGTSMTLQDGTRLFPAFKAAVRGVSPSPSEERDSGFSFAWKDPVRSGALMESVRHTLEGPPPADMSRLSDDLREAVQLLGSPFSADRAIFGVTCDISGSKLPERQALEDIVDAGRWDLVRELLRGLNPEGRVYAAQALLECDTATAGDLQAILILLAQDTPITFCSGGCVVERDTMARLLPEAGRRGLRWGT